MTTYRHLVLSITYQDDTDNPRLLNLDDELAGIVARWERHLATPVDIVIERDRMVER